MADVRFEVVRVGLPTSGTVDATISGFGTPSAAIFIAQNEWVNNAPSNQDSIAAIGFTDGTRQISFGYRDNNNQGTATTARTHSNAAVIDFVDGAGTGLFLSYGFDSWVTDGVRISLDSGSTGVNRLCTVILIGGSDVSNAYTNIKDDLGTGTSPVDITAPGFEPDLVFLLTNGDNDAAPSTDTNAIFSFGAAHNGASVTQGFTALSSRDNAVTTDVTSYVGDNSAVGQVFAGSLTWRGTVGGFDASGFSVTPSSSASSDVVGYLALSFSNDPDIAVFDVSIPTSGNYGETAPGFTPNFGLLSTLIGPTAKNTATDADMTFAVTAFDESNIYSVSSSSEDGVSTSNTGTLATDRLRIEKGDQSGDAVLASGYSFDADGWDFTLTTNPASAILGWGLAIGAGGSTAVEIDSISHSVTIDGVALTQANVLAAQGIGHSQSVESVSLAQANELEANSVEQGQTVDNGTLTQANSIAPGSVTQGQAVDNTTLTQANAIAPNSMSQGQSMDSVTLTQAHVLAPNSMTHGQSIDGITLLVAGTLDIQSVAHSQTIDEALLTVAGVLSVQGVSQAQTLEALELVQANVLAPNGITQSQSVDSATLAAASQSVSMDDVSHSQTLDATALTQYHVLSVDGLTQAQAIDVCLFGGLVIGELEGQIVIYAAMGGTVYAIPALSGTIH